MVNLYLDTIVSRCYNLKMNKLFIQKEVKTCLEQKMKIGEFEKFNGKRY